MTQPKWDARTAGAELDAVKSWWSALLGPRAKVQVVWGMVSFMCDCKSHCGRADNSDDLPIHHCCFTAHADLPRSYKGRNQPLCYDDHTDNVSSRGWAKLMPGSHLWSCPQYTPPSSSPIPKVRDRGFAISRRSRRCFTGLRWYGRYAREWSGTLFR